MFNFDIAQLKMRRSHPNSHPQTEGVSGLTGVSVLVATRNRKQSLQRVLEAVLNQSAVCEVICVDDASTDGTAQFVRERFSDVLVVELTENVGPAEARNIGARHARSQLLAILDDDCVLRDPDSLERAAAWLLEPHLAGVTLPFINVLSDQTVRTSAPKSDGTFVTSDFYAGMILFRRDVFLGVGGYRAIYFMHHEEPDLALRLLEQGWWIRNGSSPLIDHYESPVRDKTKLWRLGARNAVLFSLLNVPDRYLWFHLPATFLKTALYALPKGAIGPVLQGFLAAAGRAKEAWGQRRPVSVRAYQLFRKLRKNGPQPWEEIEPILEPARRNGAPTRHG